MRRLPIQKDRKASYMNAAEEKLRRGHYNGSQNGTALRRESAGDTHAYLCAVTGKRLSNLERRPRSYSLAHQPDQYSMTVHGGFLLTGICPPATKTLRRVRRKQSATENACCPDPAARLIHSLSAEKKRNAARPGGGTDAARPAVRTGPSCAQPSAPLMRNRTRQAPPVPCAAARNTGHSAAPPPPGRQAYPRE